MPVKGWLPKSERLNCEERHREGVEEKSRDIEYRVRYDQRNRGETALERAAAEAAAACRLGPCMAAALVAFIVV